MFHVCIFTNSAHDKFAVVGGYSEIEINQNLALIADARFANVVLKKLVIFKSFLMDEEGAVYLARVSKLEQKDLAKLVVSENINFSDQLKHLANQ
jgi:hypothetical protein